MTLSELLQHSKTILTEGALVERLKAEFHLALDAHINHASLVYSHPEILDTIYRQYLDLAQLHRLPILITTPTRKLNKESASKSTYELHALIHDNALFLQQLRESYGSFAQEIYVGGLMGCKGDAYSGAKILTAEGAFHFHQQQAQLFANENIDFLFAGIMPEIEEAKGMAMAMAETRLPYIISFMVRKEGCLLDGTAISDAIETIDHYATRPPVCYMTNCIHPSNLLAALRSEANKNQTVLRRLIGIQANASVLSPEELNHCNCLHTGDFDQMIEEMLVLKRQYNFKIFGGCCGTNEVFIDRLARRISPRKTE